MQPASRRGSPDLGTFYGEISSSYRAIDDFRTKLLGLLPIATGTAVTLLLRGGIGDGSQSPGVRESLGASGALGLLFTLGLFAYELHGMKKCHGYIFIGRRVEQMLGIPGQFVVRPPAVGRFINEPLAASVIYPASLAAWAFTGLAAVSLRLAVVVAVSCFVAGFLVAWLVRRVGAEDWDDEFGGVLSSQIPGLPLAGHSGGDRDGGS
jgi:hypothetical protein